LSGRYLRTARKTARRSHATSHRSIDEWISLFDDSIVSALDRLAHNAYYQVVMEGESFRKQQSPAKPPATGRHRSCAVDVGGPLEHHEVLCNRPLAVEAWESRS
jgi:hypothetical protein